MRWLQILVVVMGVMIIAGVAVIGITIVHRLSAHQPTAPSQREIAAAPAASPAPGPSAALPSRNVEPIAGQSAIGQSAIRVPAGARLRGMTSAGQNLVLQLETPDHGDWLYVVDPPSGLIIRRIELDAH